MSEEIELEHGKTLTDAQVQELTGGQQPVQTMNDDQMEQFLDNYTQQAMKKEMMANQSNSPDQAMKKAQEEKLYQETYNDLINGVLPEFQKATDKLQQNKYPQIAEFLINSLSGITAMMLNTSIEVTHKQTSESRSKLRKEILNEVKTRSNNFLKRMYETSKIPAETQAKEE